MLILIPFLGIYLLISRIMYLVPLTLLCDLKTLLRFNFMYSCTSTCCSCEQTTAWMQVANLCTSAGLERGF